MKKLVLIIGFMISVPNIYAATLCKTLPLQINARTSDVSDRNDKSISDYIDTVCDASKPYSVNQVIATLYGADNLGVRVCCSKL